MLKSGLAASAQTESAWAVKVSMQRCSPRSQSLTVRSEDPDRHRLPSALISRALVAAGQLSALYQHWSRKQPEAATHVLGHVARLLRPLRYAAGSA